MIKANNMSAWRRRAIACLPECSSEFASNQTTIQDVFIEMLPAVVEAHKNNDRYKLARIYAFAEWCFNQKQKDLWNSAGVMFYEHLGDFEETRKELSRWVAASILEDLKALIEARSGLTN